MPDQLFLFIVNPAAGKRDHQSKLNFISSHFKKSGFSFLLHFTEIHSPELHLNAFLRKNTSVTDIIIIGGDGTINLVINALPHFNYTLGFITNGTGNDSVKLLALSKDISKQIETIINGAKKKIDLGRCNGRYFMNGVGIGFDGEVVKEMSERLKKKKGHWAYLSIVLKKMLGKWHWPVRIFLDDRKIEREIFSITIAKGTTFGGGFKINPHAKNDDGLLDVCIFNHLNLLRRCYILPMVQLGVHGKAREVNFYKSEKVKIISQSALKAHIDGELIQSEQFEIEVIPKAINVRVPVQTTA